MSNSWPMVKLGEVLRQRQHDIPVDAAISYQFAGVYSFGRGVFRGQVRTGSQFAYQHLAQLRTGDFVYPKLMAWEGAFGIVPPECDGCFVSPEFPVFEPLSARIVPEYLRFFFQIPQVWQEISGGSIGTNVRRRRLYPDAFLKAEIPLPSVPEQRRIVARIEELAAQIDEAHALCRTAAEQTVALTVAMAHRGDLDTNEKTTAGWKRARLWEVLQIVDDSHKVQTDRSYPNLGIYSFGRGLFHKPPIDGLATSAVALRRVKSGQFIYSRLFAFEGAYGMVTDEFNGAYVSQEYPTFECDPHRVRAEFLVAYFKSVQVWKDVATGSKGLGNRRQRVQPAQVLGHELWLPPISLQTHLADVQAKVDTLRSLQAETAVELDALLPSILDRAFRGEL